MKKIPDSWILHQENWDGKPISFRVRLVPKEIIGSKNYAFGFRITWKFKESSKGFPENHICDLMEEFEELLDETFERDQHSLFVSVITHKGERDWVLYTPDPDQTYERIVKVLNQQKSVYHVEFEACPDSDWSEYVGILKNCNREP